MEKHLTTTVYIVATIKGKIKLLLHKHKKHGIWLGIGGHLKKNENPYESVIREAEEEIGIKVKVFIDVQGLTSTAAISEVPMPYMIKEEKIPKYKNQKAHYHVDLIYFGTTDTPKKVSMDEEFGWFSKREIAKLDLEDDVRFVVNAAFKSYKE